MSSAAVVIGALRVNMETEKSEQTESAQISLSQDCFTVRVVKRFKDS